MATWSVLCFMGKLPCGVLLGYVAADTTILLFLTCKLLSVNLYVTLQIQNGRHCVILNADLQVNHT